MSDNTLLIKQLTAEDFAPERFVRDVMQQCVGIADLRQYRRRLQLLADTTNGELKQNVYRNYRQLIETAREIQFLETEMYQLSHRLTEQRSLLVSLGTQALSTTQTAAVSAPAAAGDCQNSAPAKETPDSRLSVEEIERGRERLFELAERIDGVTNVCRHPGRYLLYSSELVEIDPVSLTAVCRLRGHLFNDSIMTARWLPNRRGTVRHQLEAVYQLDHVVMVNVRDDGDRQELRNAVKLLVTQPAGVSDGDAGEDGGTRILQCASVDIKQRWLREVDAAKRRCLQQQRQEDQARQTQRRGASPTPQGVTKQDGIDKEGSSQRDDEADSSVDLMVEAAVPEWLLESPEELDVLLVEHRLQDMLTLLRQCYSFVQQLPVAQKQLAQISEVSGQLRERRFRLCQQLLEELCIEPASSSCQHQLSILQQLGCSRRGTTLLLQQRSQLLRQQLRQQLRVSAGPQQVVRKLVTVAVTAITATVRDFSRVLSDSSESAGCWSLLVVWTREELAFLLSQFCRHVFSGGTGGAALTMIADSVQLLRQQVEQQLCAVGLDSSQQLSATLRRPIARAAADSRQQLVDGVRARAADDSWKPLSAEQLPAEVRSQLSPPYPPLTANTLTFRGLILQLADDLRRLYGGARGIRDAESHLVAVYSSQLQHTQRALSQPRHERSLVVANLNYLLRQLLDETAVRFTRGAVDNSDANSTVRAAPRLLSLRAEFGSGGNDV